MQTKKNVMVKILLMSFFIGGLFLASCEPQSKVMPDESTEGLVKSAEGLQTEFECLADDCNEENSNARAEGEKCWYSSAKGYCTAGVRQDKGGWDNGKGSICNGVFFSGNAKDWLANAKKTFSDNPNSTGTTPKIGAIVVWGANTASSIGHVGVITGQDKDGNWMYKAMNDYPNGFGKWSFRKVSDYPNAKNRVKPIGYIYQWK